MRILPAGSAAEASSGKADRLVSEEVGAPPEGNESPRAGTANRLGAVALAALVALCGVTLLLGFLNKDRCSGPEFDSLGRSVPDYDMRSKQDVCYSDIQFLWIGRDIDRHVFPYVNGKLAEDGRPVGGVVEYPVLTGVVIWASALFADTDAEFLLLSALVLAPFGLATAWLLGRLSGWRALLWAIGPPLVLYAFHNWELPVVLCAVAAFYVVHRGWGRRGADRPLITRATVASVLLGLGFAFKVYPAIFVLPLMLYVLTGGRGGREFAGRAAGKALDWAGAVRCALVALGTAIAVNVPFAVAGFEGWQASFTFQMLRKADITTNSIWFWGLRPDSDPDNVGVQELIGVLSPTLMMVSFVIACGLGWAGCGTRRRGPTPGSRSRPRCCAGSCCCTRSTRRSTRCGWCRCSCCCGSGGAGSSPTCWPTSRWGSASSAGTTRSSTASTAGSSTGCPPRP